MQNYGQSFGNVVGTAVGLERVALWLNADEFYPVGAVLKKSTTYPEGTRIPAGTPVYVEKPGGEATLNGTTPMALTYNDVVMGSEFATLTLVTRGTLLESRCDATITTAQKAKLVNINFIKE